MSWDDFAKFERPLQEHIRRFIDEHPVLSRMPEIDKMNAASCGAQDALSVVRGIVVDQL